ncbi:MAG: cytochrome c [Granulosicoccus sp.]
MFVHLFFILNAALFLTPVQSWAGNLDDGKSKAETTCMTCHGLDGQATLAMTANLSGQQKEYLIAQLQAFRSGKRQHEQMSIIAEMLTDDDIENVSEWYSSIAVIVELPIE